MCGPRRGGNRWTGAITNESQSLRLSPEHRRYDPGDPHGRKLDGDFRKRLDRALDRQLALENQVRAVLADYPISDQVQGLLDLLVGLARTGRGYDLETLIAILQEIQKDDASAS
jgi:hypothetical protein